MRRKAVLMILIVISLFTGCFSYRDMNRLFFSTMGFFDIDDEGEIVIYGELFSASRSEGEKGGIETRNVLNGKGETVLDAFYDYQSNTSFPIAYDVNKVLVFSETLAKQGLDDCIDSPERNQKPTIKEFLFISKSPPEEVMAIQLVEEKFIGVFLENMMLFHSDLPDVIPIRLNEFLNQRLIGNKINLIPIISVEKIGLQDRINIEGAAIVENDRMIGELSPEEVPIFKYLKGTLKIGDLNISNPQEEKSKVSLDNIKAKVKREIILRDNTVYVSYNINTIKTIEEVENGINLKDSDIREILNKETEDKIRKECLGLLKKYQEKDIDLFNVKAEVDRKYPHNKIENIIKNTDFSVEVQVEIEGSQNTTNSYK